MSPTELLIEALERFGSAEPIDCIIVYTDEQGQIQWRSNTRHHVVQIGMLELCKSCILNTFNNESN